MLRLSDLSQGQSAVGACLFMLALAGCGGGGGSAAGSAAGGTGLAVSSNTRPVAAISPASGSDAPVRRSANFNGSGSTDANGDPLTFRWALASRPTGSVAALSATSGTAVDLTPDVPGDYVVTLIVNDGKLDSAAATATLRAANAAPVANAGPDRSLRVGDTALIDGSRSSDVNGDRLTYAWSVDSRPNGSVAAIADATQPVARLVPDVAGDYILSLVVNDGSMASAPDTVKLTVAELGSNRAPVAAAGADQNVPTGTTVTLDGSASADPDGSLITYTWTLVTKPAGSAAALIDPGSARPSFVADRSGTYTVALVVNDGVLASGADQVDVNASSGNSAPVAIAGPAQSVVVGATVELDGSGSSDADSSDLLTYGWSIASRPAGSTAQLAYADGIADDPAPTFVADVAGVYVISLVVSDGKSDSAPSAVTVTAVVGNAVPVADAGDDVSTVVGRTVTLSGAQSSDANGDPLTYEWSVVSRPAASQVVLVNPTDVAPGLTPDVPGTYVLELVVSDGQLRSVPDRVVVTAGDPSLNQAPVAVAGPRQRNVVVGQTVQLDGSKSYDPNGTAVTYKWTFKSLRRSKSTLQASTTAAPTFVPDVRGNYVVVLVVSDGQLSSAPSSVMIQVRR